MKKLITIFAVLVITANAIAQAPQKMSYQAVIRNSSNALVTNQAVGMRLSILQGSASGTAVYVETQTATTNVNGLVSIEIGNGTVVSGSFATIDWSNGPFFIKSETDPAGGTSYSIAGTSQMLSVPYALHAKTAESVTGGFKHYIGEVFGGGVVFHVYLDAQGVEHGLIVALTDQSSSQAWSNVTATAVGTSAQSFWDGSGNSNAIVAQAGHSASAASLAVNLTTGGQSDWYLPSIDELYILFNQRYNVNKTLSTIGGAVQILNVAYGSSTESNASGAWLLGLGVGSSDVYPKSNAFQVRAIRAF